MPYQRNGAGWSETVMPNVCKADAAPALRTGTGSVRSRFRGVRRCPGCALSWPARRACNRRPFPTPGRSRSWRCVLPPATVSADQAVPLYVRDKVRRKMHNNHDAQLDRLRNCGPDARRRSRIESWRSSRSFSAPVTRANFDDSMRVGYSCWVSRLQRGGGRLRCAHERHQEAHLLNLSVAPKWQGAAGRSLLEHFVRLAATAAHNRCSWKYDLPMHRRGDCTRTSAFATSTFAAAITRHWRREDAILMGLICEPPRDGPQRTGLTPLWVRRRAAPAGGKRTQFKSAVTHDLPPPATAHCSRR